MRWRESDLTTTPSIFSRVTLYNGTTTTAAGKPGPVYGVWRGMWDEPHPSFKRKSNAGKLLFGPLTQYHQTFSAEQTGLTHTASYQSPPSPDSPVVYQWDNVLNDSLGPLPVGVVETLPQFKDIGDVDIESARVRAATAALAEWKAASVQSYVFLAELQKTLDTLRNPLKAMFDTLEKARRRGYWRFFKDGAQGASSEYLTWFYGLRSVMFDIEGILDALRVRASDRHTSRGHENVRGEWFSDELTLRDGRVLKVYYEVEQQETFDVRAGLLGQFDGSQLSRFGLRLSDIPASVWELTPWSFVLDWIVNVGDYIQALTVDADNDIKLQWLTETRTIKLTRRVTLVREFNVVGASDQWSASDCRDSDTGVYITKTRQSVNLADYRGLRFRGNLNRVPVLAALALVTQSLTKR